MAWSEEEEVPTTERLGGWEDKGRWGKGSLAPVAPRDRGGGAAVAPEQRGDGEAVRPRRERYWWWRLTLGTRRGFLCLLGEEERWGGEEGRSRAPLYSHGARSRWGLKRPAELAA